MGNEFWFSKNPKDICLDLGLDINAKRAIELSNIFDGNIEGWYYLSAASLKEFPEESAKWILGAIAAKLNELHKPFKYINTLMPADYLYDFVSYLMHNKFNRNFAKDIFNDLMELGVQYKSNCFEDMIRDDMTMKDVDNILNSGNMIRVRATELLDEIIGQEKYQVASDSFVDNIISGLIDKNPEKVNDAKTNPKLLQWFIGQVMKNSKGKADASLVTEKLKKVIL